MSDEKTVKKHSWWRWIRVAILSVTLVFLSLVGVFFYILLFKTADTQLVTEVYPDEDALVQRRDVVFQWPAPESPELEFRLTSDSGQVLYFARTGRTSVSIPYELLKPGLVYRWELYPIDEKGQVATSPDLERTFRVAEEKTTQTFWNPVTVFPAQLVIRPYEMLNGLALEVDYDGPWRLTLPRSLVFTDGERVLEGRGRMFVRFLFDQGRASVNTEKWGEILVWAGGQETAVPVIPGSRTDAPYAGGEDPGFNPYEDTPSFANFERTLFSRLTKGTCVGIALVVKLFFERVDFGNSRGIPAKFLTATNVLDSVLTSSRVVVASSLDFRDLTRKQPDLVMDLMSALHLENLNPLNIRDTLRAVMLDDDSSGTLQHIWEALVAGRVPVIAGFRLKKRVWKTWDDITTLAMLDSGHAFLVYRGWRFGDTSVFAVYDPNLEYPLDTPRLTTLVFPPAGRPYYRINGDIQQSLVRFLPLNSSGLFTFVAMVGQGARMNLQEAGRSVIDFYRILTLE